MFPRLRSGALALFYRLEEHSRWSALRTLGNSSLVKASVLMPAFGYILLLNESVQSLLTIKYDGWLLKYLPAVWRIWLLFYGSFFLAAASILYAMLCPPKIKQYGSGFEMADREHMHHVNLNQEQTVLGELKLARERMTPIQKQVVPDFQIGDEDAGYRHTAQGARLSRMLVYAWSIMDRSRLTSRMVIFVLFWIGLGLLAIPAGFTFAQVTILALHRLLA